MSNKDIKRASALFSEYQPGRNRDKNNTGKIHFTGVGGYDVYNITAPFASANKTVIAGRVEPRDQENSTVIFFEENDGVWTPIPDAPIFELQDPFVTVIHNELVFGGVEIEEYEGRLIWKTIFYRGTDIFSLTEFFQGPVGMKDIRLCDLNNGSIGIFTRPQGPIGGRGTIGYAQVNQLEQLTVDVIESATLLEGMFHPMDWGGVNDTCLLDNGEIGVLAHVACYENDRIDLERHYYATSFIYSPARKQYRDYKIIAIRDQFEDGPAKRKSLSDVIFSSGLRWVGGRTILYAGVSDTEAHWIEINDPFLSVK